MKPSKQVASVLTQMTLLILLSLLFNVFHTSAYNYMIWARVSNIFVLAYYTKYKLIVLQSFMFMLLLIFAADSCYELFVVFQTQNVLQSILISIISIAQYIITNVLTSIKLKEETKLQVSLRKIRAVTLPFSFFCMLFSFYVFSNVFIFPFASRFVMQINALATHATEKKTTIGFNRYVELVVLVFDIACFSITILGIQQIETAIGFQTFATIIFVLNLINSVISLPIYFVAVSGIKSRTDKIK